MNKKIILKIFILITGLWILPLFAQKPIKDLKPTVVLISLDGFRTDYLKKYNPKTLNELAKKGIRAKWMIPSFPSKTFPNHYSIATGLYPEHHGIVENNIYDFGTIFSLGKREEVQNSRWWLGEPIWVTAEKQNQRTGAFFFPGTEAEIGGKRPTLWKQYDGKIPNSERVDTILSWLELPKAERPTFYTLYFSDVDDAGHATSPDSEDTKASVLKVDEDLRRFVEGLKKRKIDKKINLIIVSDHGMAAIDLRNASFLDDVINFDETERILWTNEIVQIFPKANNLDELAEKLKNVKHANCWKKSEIPARFHYNEGDRIAPIICSTEEGWILTSRQRYEDLKTREDLTKLHGGHGYDNQLPSMQAIFIAYGKAFKNRKIIEPFENIQVYNVITSLLKLTPAKNDGNFDVANQILR